MASARLSSEAGLPDRPQPGKISRVDRIKHDIAPTASTIDTTALHNAKHLKVISDSIDTILSHPYFQDVTEAEPLGLENSGSRNSFNQQDFERSMDANGRYECACNFWWQSFKPTQAHSPTTSQLRSH